MAEITLGVEMRKGTGFGVWVTVQNQTWHFSESGEQLLTLDAGSYIATLGGQEPTTATVTISFKQGDDILASETYTDPTFFGFIPFDVK